MSEPFLGEIRMVAFNFAPNGWALCNGQILSIAQNTALFALLGTTYGGDGQTTFALPDLRGRVPLHYGAGPGLSDYTQGQTGGVESVALTANEMPLHNHLVNCRSVAGSQSQSDVATQADPVGGFPGTESAGSGIYATSPNGIMNGGMIGTAGGSQPHENRQPFLVMNFVIALNGIFPSRN